MSPAVVAGADNPSVTNLEYNAQIDDWTTVNDVIKGTRWLKTCARSKEYLPQESRETKTAYDGRLKKSIFWNAFKRTIFGLTGMVFRRDPRLGRDVPPAISDPDTGDWENIDLQGTHGDVFLRAVFKREITDGHTFILVDMPPPVTAQNPDATRADEEGRRPYWVSIGKEQVINWRSEIDANGELELTQVTIEEQITLPAGVYKDHQVTQYRVLRPGSWELWRKPAGPGSSGGGLTLYDEGTTSLDYIPLVPIYSNKTAFMMSDPPLLDLAYENLRHYRLRSDLDHILHFSNVPMIWAIGRRARTPQGDTGTREVTISPNTIIDLDKDGKIGILEHSGHAIASAQAEIQAAKESMAALGLLLLARQPQVEKTATASTLEYEAESSELAAMARSLRDGTEAALDIHAEYLGLGKDAGGTITINRDFAQAELSPQQLIALANMVATDQLSLDTLWTIMGEAEQLPSDFDPDKEHKAIETEVQKRTLPLYAPETLLKRTAVQPTGPAGTPPPAPGAPPS